MVEAMGPLLPQGQAWPHANIIKTRPVSYLGDLLRCLPGQVSFQRAGFLIHPHLMDVKGLAGRDRLPPWELVES